jgi:hypothetical protein
MLHIWLSTKKIICNFYALEYLQCRWLYSKGNLSAIINAQVQLMDIKTNGDIYYMQNDDLRRGKKHTVYKVNDGILIQLLTFWTLSIILFFICLFQTLIPRLDCLHTKEKNLISWSQPTRISKLHTHEALYLWLCIM